MLRTLALCLAFALAGCLDSSEADDSGGPTEPQLMDVHEEKTFDQTIATIVGTGVPSVQCPADAVNTEILTWDLVAPAGIEGAHVRDLVITIVGSATVNDVDLFVSGPGGGQIGSGTGGTATETVSVAGLLPVGTYQIEVRGCSGAGSVDVDGNAVLHWQEPAEG